MVIPHNGDQDPERPAALLVSCKCSMKNQCWESCMQKKKNRPLVAGRVSPIIISRSMWRKFLVNIIIPILGLSEKKAPLNPLV